MRLPLIKPDALTEEQKPLYADMRAGIEKNFKGFATIDGEGALLGLIGLAAGAVLGGGISQILIHVINPQSFNWTMKTQLPWGLLAVVGVALVTASAGTAMLAGRRALSHNAVRAVSEDW